MSDSHAIETPLAVEHADRPELRHHFADEQQQRNAASLGMWWFLGTEILFFGGMFCAYLVYRRWYFPEFAVASRSLDLIVGTVNTAVLICSSLTVALAVRAAQLGQQKVIIICLILTMLLGLVFLGIKGVEYHDKFVEHHVPGPGFHFPGHVPGQPDIPINQHHAQIFFSLYFVMTGLHAVHMVIGIGIMLVMLWLAWRGTVTDEYYSPIEISGLYWHFVDIVWIFLFPLLYLIGRHAH